MAMSGVRVGRNDPCPCGSGKKFKKCCLQARNSYSVTTPVRSAAPPARGSFARAPAPVGARNGPPPRMPALFDDLPAGTADEQPDAPKVDAVQLMPVEVGLHYTFPEPFGKAEVTFIFPGGKCFELENNDPILVEELRVGDRVILQDGQIATITAVHVYFEPPDPPSIGEDGRILSRVIGTVRHIGHVVIDVKWPGYTATNSPEHLYYSVTRQKYIPANQLEVGEFLRTDDNLVTPVQQVSEPRFGLIDLYNIEVEHFHNYYVGAGDGKSVLVHNGVPGAGCNINIPRTPSRTITRIGDLTRQEADALARVWRGQQPLSTLPLWLRQQLGNLYSGVAAQNAPGFAQRAFNEARARYLLGQGPNPGPSVVDFAQRMGIPVHRP
jgi:hypothetical protein